MIMSKCVKRVLNKKEFWVDVLVALFISLEIVLNIVSNILYLWIVFPIFTSVFVFIYYFIVERMGNKTIFKCYQKNIKDIYTIFILSFVVVLGGQLFYWLAYFPGGFNLDAYGHWEQVHGYMKLNDWHNVLVTGIYWGLTRISDTIEFCVLFQIILFSLSYAILIKCIARKGVSGFLLFVASFYVSINPAIGMNNVCITKDVYFSIAFIWLYIFLIRIIDDDNSESKHFLLFFITFLSIAITLIRHNGILAIVPMWIVLIVQLRKEIKQIVTWFGVFAMSILLIKGPVFHAINVTQHSNVVGEMTGLPMAMMVNAYINEPENIPYEVEEFLTEIADRNTFESMYIVGEWDSCRWNLGGTKLLNNENLFKILRLTCKTVIACPQSSYESLRENTRIIWQVIGDVEWEPWVYIEEPNEFGITERCIESVRNIEKISNKMSHTFIGETLLWNLGGKLLIVGLLCVYIVVQKQLKKLILIIPVVSYVLGTMLLLCGPNHRYFYFFEVIIFPMIFLCLLSENRNE